MFVHFDKSTSRQIREMAAAQGIKPNQVLISAIDMYIRQGNCTEGASRSARLSSTESSPVEIPTSCAKGNLIGIEHARKQSKKAKPKTRTPLL